MNKRTVLLRSAWDILRSDGPWALTEQTLRYLALYGRPDRVASYWVCRITSPEVTKDVQGSIMRLDLRDKGISTDLFMNGIREPHATKYLQSILRPDWTVVDIGANIGYYVLIESLVVKKVIAIEPVPLNFKHLRKNVSLNKCSNVELHEVAIGDKDDVAYIEVGKASNWSKISTAGPMGVLMRTLDTILEGRPVDFIRMDVEGYEMNVLKGMEDTLSRNQDLGMFIEVHRDGLKEYGSSQLEFLEYLADLSFSLEKSFILAKEGPSGPLKELLSRPRTRKAITERGMASHMFFRR